MPDSDFFPRDRGVVSEHKQEEWYVGLPVEVVQSLEQRAVRLKAIVARSAIEIGRELADARQEIQPYKNGGFQGWITQKIGITDRYAYSLIQVYEQFGKREVTSLSQFVNESLRLLAAPSVAQEAREEALARAEAGEKITVKLAKEIIEAQQAQRQAEEAEQQAREEALLAQQEIANLTQRIEELQDQIASFVQPEIEIREVEKEVIPPETAATLETLRLRVQELTEQKKNLSKRVEQLGSELYTWRESHEAERERELRELRICQNWREVTSTFYKQVVKLLGQFPSPLDAQIFAAAEWDQLYQLEELAQRFLVECRKLREGPQRIMVDADP